MSVRCKWAVLESVALTLLLRERLLLLQTVRSV